MTITMFDDDQWMVQVQRDGIRKTKRGKGGVGAARAFEKRMLRQVTLELKERERQRKKTDPEPERDPDEPMSGEIMTLRQYYETRWAAHARVVQCEHTIHGSRPKWNYLLHYLGDLPLSECAKPKNINSFIEDMLEKGPISFARCRNGKPRKRRQEHLSKITVNHCLTVLRSALYLAYKEEMIPLPPDIELLRPDDRHEVTAPSEKQYKKLMKACEFFRPWAPLLPEVVDLTAHTGMRRAEVFTLTWESVDLEKGSIRIETQGRAHTANGKIWRPKHGRHREIPLSDRAKEIIGVFMANKDSQRPHLVVPSVGGAPYNTMYRQGIPEKGKGKGYFFDAVEMAGLKGIVTFHVLRHLFAVRLLTKGVPIAVVSELLGHANINLSVKTYGKYAPDAQIKFDAVKLLDELDE